MIAAWKGIIILVVRTLSLQSYRKCFSFSNTSRTSVILWKISTEVTFLMVSSTSNTRQDLPRITVTFYISRGSVFHFLWIIKWIPGENPVSCNDCHGKRWKRQSFFLPFYISGKFLKCIWVPWIEFMVNNQFPYRLFQSFNSLICSQSEF